jgi:flagellar biosynthesis/type III secretory pathway ATPase
MIKRFNIIFFLVICSIAIPVYAQRVTLTFNDVSMSEALKGTVLDETGQPCPMPTSPAASIKAPVPAMTRNPACRKRNHIATIVSIVRIVTIAGRQQKVTVAGGCTCDRRWGLIRVIDDC